MNSEEPKNLGELFDNFVGDGVELQIEIRALLQRKIDKQQDNLQYAKSNQKQYTLYECITFVIDTINDLAGDLL